PDVFPDEALEEARLAAHAFREDNLEGRRDFTGDLVVTIDPAAARDFVDAVSVTRDQGTGHRQLTVHVAAGSRCASRRGPDDRARLLDVRELALLLRKRRMRRGALELVMPEAELELDDQGRVVGAHFRAHDLSHQVIEECMLAANEAVAEELSGRGVPFLRRVHADPDPHKLDKFADFARSLGYKMDWHTDRFALQRILKQSAARPD